MSTTRQDWRKFHYGAQPQKEKISSWVLISPTGNEYARGNYALCVHVRNEKESVDPSLRKPQFRLKIVPAHKYDDWRKAGKKSY